MTDVGGSQMELDRLALADWRRRISTLYAEVRALALDDPELAHGHWRDVREHLFRTHPQSPVPAPSRDSFRAAHWPYDPALRFELEVVPALPTDGLAPMLELPNSGSDALSFARIGTVAVPFADGERRLSLFWMQSYAGGLFLPFRDGTNGRDTYPAGRYVLDTAKGADLGGDPESRKLVLDFNFSYQPSCAFDPRWACPLAPPENRLDVMVRAGERVT